MSLDPAYRAAIRLLRLYTMHTPIRRGKGRVSSLVHWCADRLSVSRPLVVKSYDGRWFEISPHEAQYRMGLLGEGRYEPAETRIAMQQVMPGHVVCDVGANFGWYTTLLSGLVGDQGQVHAFEPVPATSLILGRNCELNGCRNVRIQTLALGARPGQRTMFVPGTGASGDASMYPGEGRAFEPITCATTTLDTYAREAGLTRCDFIKCDIEGAELEFLQGAADVIRRHRPVLMMEVNPACLRRANASGRQLLDAVNDRGAYRFHRLLGNGALRAIGPAAVDDGESYFTVVATPVDKASNWGPGAGS